MPYFLFDNMFFFNCHKNVQEGSGSVIQDYGPADLDPNEIFTDPQHYKTQNDLYLSSESL